MFSLDRRNRVRCAALVLATLTFAVAGCVANDPAPEEATASPTPPAEAAHFQTLHPDAVCSAKYVQVTLPGVGDASIYGELCTPEVSGDNSGTIQLLVPGSSYNHSYFDLPVQPDQYSYVSDALAAGYSTFAIDRLATGKSTLPASSDYTNEASVEAIHQVITGLRGGTIGQRTFDHVVWVGHSLGSAFAWNEAQIARDVDAFVLTGMSHVNETDHATTQDVEDAAQPEGGPGDDAELFPPAKDDPKFSGTITDPAYQTSAPGIRQFFYNADNADPAVIAADEELKDVSLPADSEVEKTLTLPPLESTSRAIEVPTLLVVGQYDRYCTAPTCTRETLLANETPYYSEAAELDAIVVPDSGHSVQLHRDAPKTNASILDWIDRSL